MPDPHTIAITGIGPISAIGIGARDFYGGIDTGRDGRRPDDELTDARHNIQRVARCLDFFVEDYLESEKTYLDRCSEFTLAACALALKDAALDWRNLDRETFGISLGTAYACLDSAAIVTKRVQQRGLHYASPMIFTHSFPNMPVSLAAIEYHIEGPSTMVCTGDTSSAAAIQYAFDVLRDDRARVMLAGGVDVLSAPLLAAIDSAGSPHFIPGEGACLLLLETTEHARQRDAQILAEIAGIGLADDRQKPGAAIDAALRDARMQAAPQRATPTDLYGHTFGAEFALRIATAMHQTHQNNNETLLVHIENESGRSAAAVLRKCQ